MYRKANRKSLPVCFPAQLVPTVKGSACFREVSFESVSIPFNANGYTSRENN